MPAPVIVTYDRKSYTWDGRRWYGTEDHMAPPLGMVHRLNALIPPAPVPTKAKKPVGKRRSA